MKCPNPECDAIMLIDWFKWIDKGTYQFQETCTVCRVIHRRTEYRQVQEENK